jgi:hypothetical protein
MFITIFSITIKVIAVAIPYSAAVNRPSFFQILSSASNMESKTNLIPHDPVVNWTPAELMDSKLDCMPQNCHRSFFEVFRLKHRVEDKGKKDQDRPRHG